MKGRSKKKEGDFSIKHMKGTVIILDFGSQYTQLIARRVRELNVYCEIHPYKKDISDIEGIGAVILSGSPFSVKDEDTIKAGIATLQRQESLVVVKLGKHHVPIMPDIRGHY